MELLDKELPGDVLIAFRTALGFQSSREFAGELSRHLEKRNENRLSKGGSRTVFANLSGLSYSTVTRLEEIRYGTDPTQWHTHFRRRHIENFSVWKESEPDIWKQFEPRFMAALKRQASYSLEHDPLLPADKTFNYVPISADSVQDMVDQVIADIKKRIKRNDRNLLFPDLFGTTLEEIDSYLIDSTMEVLAIKELVIEYTNYVGKETRRAEKALDTRVLVYVWIYRLIFDYLWRSLAEMEMLDGFTAYNNYAFLVGKSFDATVAHLKTNTAETALQSYIRRFRRFLKRLARVTPAT